MSLGLNYAASILVDRNDKGEIYVLTDTPIGWNWGFGVRYLLTENTYINIEYSKMHFGGGR